MAVMGRLRIVVLKIATVIKETLLSGKYHDSRFRRPGRISHHYEDGKDYKHIKYDESCSVDDLLPKENDIPKLPTELNYILSLNFLEPVPKT